MKAARAVRAMNNVVDFQFAKHLKREGRLDEVMRQDARNQAICNIFNRMAKDMLALGATENDLKWWLHTALEALEDSG
jgi:hypothetical protein